MAIVIPQSRIYGDVKANLVNNNAINNVQIDISRQVINFTNFEIIFRSIAHATNLGIFVTAGLGGLANSTDGKTFTKIEEPVGLFYGIVYAQDIGRFVAVGETQYGAGLVAYSDDGQNFFVGSITSTRITGIAYGNGRFVTTHISGGLSWSTNGITFIQSSTTTGAYASIAYGNGKFVAVGFGVVAYSIDGGSTFTSGTMPLGDWRGIAYAQDIGKFVAVGARYSTSSRIAYSNDGITFTNGTIPVADWNAITYSIDEKMFVAVGGIGQVGAEIVGSVAYSLDGGLTFTSGTISSGTFYGIVATPGGKFVAVGEEGREGFPQTGTSADSTDGKVFTNKIVSYEQAIPQVFGQGNNPFKMIGNELLTTTTRYNDPILGMIPMAEYLANRIIPKWKNGRMTVQFTCDYHEYKYHDGGTIYKRLIAIGEEVILWDDRASRNQPLLRNADGGGKKFMVTSNEMEGSGVVLQNISALEVIETATPTPPTPIQRIDINICSQINVAGFYGLTIMVNGVVVDTTSGKITVKVGDIITFVSRGYVQGGAIRISTTLGLVNLPINDDVGGTAYHAINGTELSFCIDTPR